MQAGGMKDWSRAEYEERGKAGQQTGKNMQAGGMKDWSRAEYEERRKAGQQGGICRQDE